MKKVFQNNLSTKSMSFKDYEKEYNRSISDPNNFWKEKAKTITWIKKFTKVRESTFEKNVAIKWFSDGTLNVSYNCLDRHLKKNGNKTAIIWESDDPAMSREITYKELHNEVCRFSNGLTSLGVKKGDRVTIYMPMVPEAAIAMLSCARLGAIHSVVFGGFAPESLKNRLEDCNSSFLITANEGLRGGKKIPLLSNVKKSLEGYKKIKKTIVLKRTDCEKNAKNSILGILGEKGQNGQNRIFQKSTLNIFLRFTSPN